MPAAGPQRSHRRHWGAWFRLRGLVALVAVLWLAGAAIGWATNTVDGYYGITRVDSPPDAPGQLTVLEVALGSPADRAGLRPGDVILAVDGDPLAEAPSTRGPRIPANAAPAFRLRPLAIPTGDAPAFRRVTSERAPGERRTLRIQRRGDAESGSGQSGAQASGRTTEDLTLVLGSRLGAPEVVVALLTWNVVGLLTLGVGVVVALRRPGDLEGRLLLVTGSCFALALALLSWNNRPLAAEASLALVPATVLLLILGCAALLHLFLAFPAPHPLLSALRRRGPAGLAPLGGGVAALYAAPLGLALGVFLGPVVVWPWAFLVVTALPALALLVLGRSMRYPPSPVARAQLKWIAGALAVGLAALILGPGVNVATGARMEVLSPTGTVAAWALFPLAVGVAVMRYRLFDVNLVLRAAAFYPLLAALLAGGYLAAALALGRVAATLMGPGAAGNPTISVLAALLVAALAQPVHRRLQAGLDQLLYRDRLTRQRLLEEARVALGQALAPEEVAQFLTGHVVDRLGLTGAWLVLPSGVTASQTTSLTASLRASLTAGQGAVPAALLGAATPLIAHLSDATSPLLLATQEEAAGSGVRVADADEPALAPWYAAGARLLLPLCRVSTQSDGAGDGLLGVWLVGRRRSGASLDSEDIEALSQVARQATVLLDYDRLHRQQAAERQRTARFRRYFSPQIAELIAGERAELATHRRELTMLSADLHGFAALGEVVEPEDVVKLLNEYLAAMTDVLFAHGGTLDKYLGDGVTAFFGDPLPQPDHAARALRAARAMQQRFADLREGWAAGRAPLSLGIGLATGWVTVGTIGLAARQEYTVVGDAANVALRLAATAGPGEVLLSEKTLRLAGEDIPAVPHGEVLLAGGRQPLPVFAVANESAPRPGGTGAAVPGSSAGDRADGADSEEAPSDADERVVDLLSRTALFGSLPPHALAALAGRLRRRRFRKGATIVRVGEPASTFFLIETGTVKVLRPLATGDEAVMNILGPGEFFGELALLDRQGPAATVAALEPAEILVLSREDFLVYVQAYPTAASAAIRMLSERIRHLGDQLEEAYGLELPQRLARRLLLLGRTHGKQTAEGLAIDLPLTQSDLAGMIGASRQRVNRLLAEWQDRHLLRLGLRGTIVIREPDLLTELCQEVSEN